MEEITLKHKEYTISKEELLEKLGIKGEILVNIDDLRVDNMIMIKTIGVKGYVAVKR